MKSLSIMNISIEYAHIYTNAKIEQEQQSSLDILAKITKKLAKEDSTYSLVVMVDDYSFPDPDFDYTSFNSWLGKQGFTPDIVFQESWLISTCDEVLRNLVDKKLKAELEDYIQDKKYPCSLFIAAWYLLRLGYLNHPRFDTKLVSNRLLNILPLSFKPFEDKALEIIASTSFTDATSQIEYSFLKGRPVPGA